MSEANKALVREIYAAMDRGGWAEARGYATPDFRAYLPGAEAPLDGEAFGGFVDLFYAGFPDLVHEIRELVAEGDRVSSIMVVHGTNTGEFDGMPATGRAVEFPAQAVMRIVDGKCASVRPVFDQLLLLRQLGVIPAPGAAPAPDPAARLRDLYDAFNRRAFHAMLDRVAEDWRGTQIPFGATHEGHEGWIRAMEGWVGAFGDAVIEVRSIVAGEEGGVVEFVGRGTHTGPLQGPTATLLPTGRRVEIPFCDVYRLRDGKIAETRTYFDLATMLGQLGAGAPAQPQHFDLSGALLSAATPSPR